MASLGTLKYNTVSSPRKKNEMELLIGPNLLITFKKKEGTLKSCQILWSYCVRSLWVKAYFNHVRKTKFSVNLDMIDINFYLDISLLDHCKVDSTLT